MNEKSNKLISLLAGLDRAQRRGCRKLLLSPFFNGSQDLVDYFDEITRRMDKGRDLDKRAIWRRVHGAGRPFNDVRFRKFTSDLFKLVREYLIQEELGREQEVRNYLYLAALKRQEAEKIIQGVERNWDSIATAERITDPVQYLFRHLLEYRKFSLLNYKQKSAAHANLDEINESLDLYYAVTKLMLASDAESRKQRQEQHYDFHFLPQLLSVLDGEGTYLDNPLLNIVYLGYKMLTEDAETDYYFRYREALFQLGQDTEVVVSYSYILPALNYCVRKIAQGKRNFLAEYLSVYRFALEHGVYSEDGVIDPGTFKNTIQIAMLSGDYDWAESYIQEYQAKLPERERANSVAYNLAVVNFYRKDYDAALTLLYQAEFEDSTYNLNARVMLLAIYYETDADAALESLFDSTSAYLNRHKEISPNNQQGFRALVSLTRRLTRLLPGDGAALDKLRADLARQRFVASRSWLTQKIAEFGQL